MDRRFTALHVIGSIFKVFAWIALILGILLAVLSLVLGFTMTLPFQIVGLQEGGALVGVGGFVVSLILALLLYLSFYAAGEFVYLLLAVEENTRRTAYLVQQQYLTVQSGYPPTPQESSESADTVS